MPLSHRCAVAWQKSRNDLILCATQRDGLGITLKTLQFQWSVSNWLCTSKYFLAKEICVWVLCCVCFQIFSFNLQLSTFRQKKLSPVINIAKKGEFCITSDLYRKWVTALPRWGNLDDVMVPSPVLLRRPPKPDLVSPLEWLGYLTEISGENWAHAVSYPGCTDAGSWLNLHFSPSPCCATAITFFFSLLLPIPVYIICTMNHLNTRKEWETAFESRSRKYSACCYRLI